jgi:hypothetical protein
VVASVAAAPSALAQRVSELGVQATVTLADPALMVAGPAAALRLSERGRLAVAAGIGTSDGSLAWRAEALGHFLLAPRRRSGIAAYAGAGVVAVGGPVDRGYLVLALGLERAPGARSGWFVEGGVGGGVRLAVGWRRRWVPPWWDLAE